MGRKIVADVDVKITKIIAGFERNFLKIDT